MESAGDVPSLLAAALFTGSGGSTVLPCLAVHAVLAAATPWIGARVAARARPVPGPAAAGKSAARV